MPTENSKDPLDAWEESAPYWRKHAAIVRKLFETITVALLEAAAIDRAGSVLDVAGGAVEPSLTIATALHEKGSVVFTDAVREMVLTTRDEADRSGLTNLHFTQCVGEALPFHNHSFDAVVSRLGVMLFSDPAASLREMIRVLKPDGRVALAVWHTQISNHFFYFGVSLFVRYVEYVTDV